MEISLEEVREILAFIGTLDCQVVEVTVGDVHLVVRKGASGSEGSIATHAPPDHPGVVAADPVAASAKPAPEPPSTLVTPTPVPPAPGSPVASDPPRGLDEWRDRAARGEVVIVNSPMVATFYRAKEPGAAPFVEVGSVVKEGDPLCLLEVMKLFQTIGAQLDATVEAILVADGALVEYEQPLLALRPR